MINIFAKKRTPYMSSQNQSVYAPMSTPTNNVYRSTPTAPMSIPKPRTAPMTQNMSIPGQKSAADIALSQPRTTPAPTPQPQPQTQPTTAQTYADKMQTMADRQKAFALEQQKQSEDYIKKSYALANKGLDSAIPGYQDAFNIFKNNSEAGIKDIQASGERQKAQTRDYYAEANLQAAKARNQTRAQTQQTFSNLGTIDSRGEGSFQQATENTDSAFNSTVQGNLKAQADKLSEIDMQVGQAERQAQGAIQAEEAKMNTLIQQIKQAQQQNNMDQAQALVQAYNASQQNIFDIQSAVEGLKYQAEFEKEKLGIAAQSSGATNNNNKALSMVNGLLSGDSYKAISGLWQPGNVPIINQLSGTGDVAAKWEGLKNLLALAGRGQLKGSGAVSDFEARMLEKAALAGLDPSKQSEAQFMAGLQQLKRDLESGGAVDNTMPGTYNSSNDPLGIL